jgi:hypothetical protein
MHYGLRTFVCGCVNTTLLCHTLLFTLICGRDLRDSTIRGHVGYKPAYSSAFTVYVAAWHESDLWTEKTVPWRSYTRRQA